MASPASSPTGYSVRVTGPGLPPEYPTGCMVIVDPNRTPKRGDAVAVCPSGESGPYLAILALNPPPQGPWGDDLSPALALWRSGGDRPKFVDCDALASIQVVIGRADEGGDDGE